MLIIVSDSKLTIKVSCVATKSWRALANRAKLEVGDTLGRRIALDHSPNRWPKFSQLLNEK